MTIRKRLALWYSGLVAIIIIILSLAVITISRVSILNTIDQFLLQSARDISRSVTVVPVGEFGALNAQMMVRSGDVASSPGLSVQIWQTHDGSLPVEPDLLYASADSRFLTDGLDPNMIGAAAPSFSSLTLRRIPARVATVPVNDPVSGQQIGVVQVATSIQSVQHANQSFLIVVLVAASISIVVSVMLSLWLSGRVLRPVDKITEAAASVARAEDLSTRLAWDGPRDELGRLANVFNHMMERLEHLFSVQQRFVGDVSHELRTPLTSILGNLELMERYGVDQDSLEAVHREADRMSRMVNDLLLLARADYGEIQIDLDPMELDPIVLDVFEQAHILKKDRDLRIELGRFESAYINGNVDRIRQLLLNLIANAIKFTPDGGAITVSVYTLRGEAVIEVRDTGIGITPDDQKRIFDRFFQADNSRQHRTDEDGAGLGLSIAHWIIQAHRGRVELQSTPGKGTRFLVYFPALTDKPTSSTGQHMLDRSEAH